MTRECNHEPLSAVRVLLNYDDTEHTFDTPVEALEWLREHGLGLVITQGLTSVSAIDQVCKLMTASEDADVDVNLRSLAQSIRAQTALIESVLLKCDDDADQRRRNVL